MPEFVAPEPVAQDRERARVATGDELAALLHHPSADVLLALLQSRARRTSALFAAGTKRSSRRSSRRSGQAQAAPQKLSGQARSLFSSPRTAPGYSPADS